MGESCSAKIFIGGPLSHSRVEEFIQEIRDNGAGPEWEGGLPEDIKTADDLMRLINSDGHLELMDDQASWGGFEGLENYCVGKELSFDRYTAALPGHWDAHWTKYRPDQGEFEVLSNSSYGEYIFAEHALAAQRALKSGDIHSALEHLDRAIGHYGDIPPLPPFTIKD